MKDHETVITEKLRSELIEENKRLEGELFKKMPLKHKIHTYFFAIVFVGGIFYGIWLVGYIVYKLVFRVP